jgi:hypothetical protein
MINTELPATGAEIAPGLLSLTYELTGIVTAIMGCEAPESERLAAVRREGDGYLLNILRAEREGFAEIEARASVDGGRKWTEMKAASDQLDEWLEKTRDELFAAPDAVYTAKLLDFAMRYDAVVSYLHRHTYHNGGH